MAAITRRNAVKSTFLCAAIPALNNHSIPEFGNRTEMAAVTSPASNQTAYLRERGREGLFYWSDQKHFSNVSADPQQGIFVAPIHDQSGTQGAWIRVQTEILTPEMFGAVGDGMHNDDVALTGLTRHGRRAGKLSVRGTEGKTYTHSHPYLFANIPFLDLDLGGASIQNILGTQEDTDFLTNYTALAFPTVFETQGHENYTTKHPHTFGSRIGSVQAGSRELTLSDDLQGFSANDRVLIYGFECLGYAEAMPPCPKYFEFNTVAGVSGSRVTLQDALRYSYDSEWLDFGSKNVFGKPRILSLDRPDFVLGRNIVIRNGKIAANPSWSSKNATKDRNGRLQLAGFSELTVDNVDVGGAIYVSTGRSARLNHVTSASTIETDKCVTKVLYRGVSAEQHILGNGAHEITFTNCRFSKGVTANPIESLVVRGGQFGCAGAYSSRVLFGMGGGTKSIVFENNPRFFVDDPQRRCLLINQVRRLAIETLDGDGFTISRDAFLRSGIIRCTNADIGGLLYSPDGIAAFRIARLAYQTGERVRFDGSFLKHCDVGDNLCASFLQRVDATGVKYEGPYANRIRTFSTADPVLPFPVSVTDVQRGADHWWFDQSDCFTEGTRNVFLLGSTVAPEELVIDVKTASLRAELAFVNVLTHPSNDLLARIDLRVAARRTLNARESGGLVGADTVNPWASGPITALAFGTSNRLSDDTGSRWRITLSGKRG